MCFWDSKHIHFSMLEICAFGVAELSKSIGTNMNKRHVRRPTLSAKEGVRNTKKDSESPMGPTSFTNLVDSWNGPQLISIGNIGTTSTTPCRKQSGDLFNLFILG